MNEQDIRQHLGLRPIINVSGTMASLGASIAPPEVVEAVAAILPQFVEIDDLQKRASRVSRGSAGPRRALSLPPARPELRLPSPAR